MYIIENSDGIKFLNKIILNSDGTTSVINLGPLESDPSTPEEGDLTYNSTDKALKFHNGTEWEPILSGTLNAATPIQFNVNSDDTVSAAAIFKGFINIDTDSQVFNDTRLSSVNYETSEDDGNTWVTHATISDLNTWVVQNITTDTDVYLIRAIGIYAASQVGEAEIKFEYIPEELGV